MPGIPTVTAESECSDIQYGHNHTITCTISSVPAYTEVYWEHITNETTTNITSESLGFDGITLTRPSLKILKANAADSGDYICNALNLAGHGRSNSIKLTVLGNESYPIVGIESNIYNVRFLDSVTIKCSVQENQKYPVQHVHWENVNNGVLTTIESGYKGIAGSTTTTPSLTLETVTTSESGMYSCFATNDIGTAKSKPIYVTVSGGLPVVNIPKKRYTIWYGQTVTLTCDITADPSLKFIYWERITNETRTVLNRGSIGIIGITPNNPSLTLKYSTKADTGVYRCFATNDVGTGRSEPLSLQVIGEKPHLNTSVNFLIVQFGEKATLMCYVYSNLPINIVYWEKDINGIITKINTGDIGTDGISLNNPSLTVLYSTSVDSGLYTCFAGNVVGKGNSLPINFTVIGGLPVVTIASSNYTTIYGREIVIECNVTAYPPVTLVYYQRIINNSVSTLNGGAIRTKGINTTMPSLVLTFPTTEDSGIYICFASNKAGTQKSLPATLLVEGDIPVVTIRSLLYIAHFGDSITLECDIRAIPPHTTVFWYKTVNAVTTVIESGYTGTFGITLKTPSMTIIFATSAETGRYSCLASNAAGTGKSQSTYLDVHADIPEVVVPSEIYTTGVDYTVTLVCVVLDASPEVIKVYWQRFINNATTVITYASAGVDGVTVDNPSLTIRSAKESMSGEYTCFAINYVGTGSSFPTFLKGDNSRTSGMKTVDPKDIEVWNKGKLLKEHLRKMIQSYKERHDIPVLQLAKFENDKSLELYSLDELKEAFKTITGKNLNDYLSFGNEGHSLEYAQQLMHWTITYANDYDKNKRNDTCGPSN
ncbi:hemicentin-1-like [Mytilus trossulus]|uniref:hemicentin-1-like n=1 Tax=Mytilus trossulus TaxID=6551 RepID=UPI0030074CB1